MNPDLFPPEHDIKVINWGKYYTRSVHITLDGDAIISVLSTEKPDGTWTDPHYCVLRGSLTAREMDNLSDSVEIARMVGHIIANPSTTEEDITDVL